jgi:hypothetical protein
VLLWSEAILIERETKRNMLKIFIVLHVTYSLFLYDFNKTGIFSTVISKNTQISNLIKIRPVGAELFHVDTWTDRRTEMMKLTVVFRNSANASKMARMVHCVPENMHRNPLHVTL